MSLKPVSICGAVTALEPTNHTRSTMRARTWPANAVVLLLVGRGPRIRAMRPAEQIWSTSRAQR